jgi:hypothetical protein
MGGNNMKTLILLLLLTVALPLACFSQTNPADRAGSSTELERMPELLETRFALSASPPHLRDQATVFLLDPAQGYFLKRQGTNGVSCIVVRSDWQFDQPFRNDIYWAVCFDAEGSRTLLLDYLSAAELRARGLDSKQVHQQITKKFGTPDYPNPSRTGVAYMIAPVMRGFTAATEPQTMNMPHYMFYAPNVKDVDIGGNGFSKQYPFMLGMSHGRDDYIIILVGETEKAKILQDSKDLLDELCSYRSFLCTTAATKARTPIDRQ